MKRIGLFFVVLIVLLGSYAHAETWKADCNTCIGDKNGVYGCTLMYCGPHFGEDGAMLEIETVQPIYTPFNVPIALSDNIIHTTEKLKVEWINKSFCEDFLEDQNEVRLDTAVKFYFGNKAYELGRREDGVIVSRLWTSCDELYGGNK